MNDIRQQNDWAEFRAHLRNDIDSQVTSNKALLWVSIGVLSMSIVAIMVCLFSTILTVNTQQMEINRLKEEVSVLKMCTKGSVAMHK